MILVVGEVGIEAAGRPSVRCFGVVEAGRTVAPFWSVPHAQVYAQCDRLLAAGLLTQVRQESGRGRLALRDWLADPEFVPVEARERGILKLWFGARPDEIAPVQLAEHRSITALTAGVAIGCGLAAFGAALAVSLRLMYAREVRRRSLPAPLPIPRAATAMP